jgi:hypothetical protein
VTRPRGPDDVAVTTHRCLPDGEIAVLTAESAYPTTTRAAPTWSGTSERVPEGVEVTGTRPVH